jgi:hypothetical protein
MPEFTREIKQAQQQASIQPQMRAPTQSLGGDLANLATTGVELYQKIKGQEKLADLSQQEAAWTENISKGAESYNNFLRELKSNPDLSPTQYGQYADKFLRNNFGSAEERISVRQLANKTSGTSLIKIADKEAESQLQAVERRREMELKAVAAAQQVGASTASIQNMSESELHSLMLKGEANKSQRIVAIAKLEEQQARFKTDKERRNAQSSLWRDFAGQDYAASVSSKAATFVQANGGLNSQTAPELVAFLTEEKMSIRNNLESQYVRTAREMGFHVSQDDIKKTVEVAEQGIDAYIDALSNDKVLKTLQNSIESIYQGSLMSMLVSPTENTRTAAFNILGAKFVGEGFKMEDFDIQVQYASAVASGTLNPDEARGVGSQYIKESVNFLSPIDPNRAPERYGFVSDTIDGLLDGTPKQREAVASTGVIPALTKVIAEQGDLIVDPMKAEDHANQLWKSNSKMISATVAKISTAMSSEKSDQVKQYMQDPLGSFGVELLEDGAGLKFVGTARNVRPNKEIEALNTFVKDTLKSFDTLGMSEDYKKRFVNDILTSISISPSK